MQELLLIKFKEVYLSRSIKVFKICESNIKYYYYYLMLSYSYNYQVRAITAVGPKLA